jgi:periplasmic divalent cation tolerance protein
VSHLVVFVTVPSSEEAQRIARVVVDERLAACANIVSGVASRYWWNGRVEEAAEVLLILKTRQALLEALTARVRSLHSYTIPEVIAVPILGGNPEYLTWIDDSTASSQSAPSTQSSPSGTDSGRLKSGKTGKTGKTG